MKSVKTAAAAFARDERGTYAILAAVGSALIAGAVGVGVDTYRLESARTALDHAVNLTCDRIANADLALYPTLDERIEMGKQFATEQTRRTSLNPSRTKFVLTEDGGVIKVKGTTSLDGSFTRVLGFKTLGGASERDCRPPSRTPPTQACGSEDLVYLNPGDFSIAAGTLIAGSASYAATLFDEDGTILARQVIGNGSGETEVFLRSSDVNDMIVVQPFRADGTVPAICNPTLNPQTSCNGDPATCPANPPPANGGDLCTVAKAEELAIASDPRAIRGWTPSPFLAANTKDGIISYFNFRIATSANFEPEVFFPKDFYYQRYDVDNGYQYLGMLLGAPTQMQKNLARTRSDAKIFRVIGHDRAVWEYKGQCVVVVSPIVLDLIGKGEITTTGVSSARYFIPQHRVNATVDFDMGGTGKAVRSEWITGNGQALLVDNRDGKAATDMNGTRLFGNMGGYEDGYKKLATLDVNGDGKISDAELQGLAAWIDSGDAKVQDGELKTLADVGITELSTKMTQVATGDGGTHMRSTAVMNGKEIMTEDVWFGIDLTAKTAAAGNSEQTLWVQQ